MGHDFEPLSAKIIEAATAVQRASESACSSTSTPRRLS